MEKFKIFKQMVLFHTIKDIQNYLKSSENIGKSIGFVPTMGALHAGHLSLIQRSKQENDLTVCSIFVNPTQFNNPEDLIKYPRTLEADSQLLEQEQCDIVFAPSAEEMYPNMQEMSMNFGNLEQVMEGKFRPGHFNGVGIVVSKLFNIIKPTKSYFGLKDLQQVAVISRMVKDLSYDLDLVVCPTFRENDGLAMSSRNVRLSPAARTIAPKIYDSLLLAKDSLTKNSQVIDTKNKIEKFYGNYPEFTLEYFEICNFETLEPITIIDKNTKTAICVAAFLDGVRLIDNIVF